MRVPLAVLTLVSFIITGIIGPMPVYAQEGMYLPKPGVMVHLSPPLNPPVLKGVTVHPENPFQFDFILDRGDTDLSNDQLKEESKKLVKYFLSSITTPEKDLWVNLSPYEKNRIIPQSFGQTDMGRDLLAEDYILKQITASLIYPEEEIGKEFWRRVYQEAEKKFGTTNIPVNTFNKVWIVPDHAKVYEHGNTAFVVKATLKVMLEQDYLSLEKHTPVQQAGSQGNNDVNALGSQIVREIVIPQLEKEVNEDKNFAPLRQVYYSLILAMWFKKRMKDSILGRKYMDQNKVKGIHYDHNIIVNPAGTKKTFNDTEAIYLRYLRAFKKGVYNYIKEDIDPVTQETIPRKYFSGGFEGAFRAPKDFAMTHNISPDEIPSSDTVVGIEATLATQTPGLATELRNKSAHFSQAMKVRIEGDGLDYRKYIEKAKADTSKPAVGEVKIHMPDGQEVPFKVFYTRTWKNGTNEVNSYKMSIHGKGGDIINIEYFDIDNPMNKPWMILGASNLPNTSGRGIYSNIFKKVTEGISLVISWSANTESNELISYWMKSKALEDLAPSQLMVTNLGRVRSVDWLLILDKGTNHEFLSYNYSTFDEFSERLKNLFSLARQAEWAHLPKEFQRKEDAANYELAHKNFPSAKQYTDLRAQFVELLEQMRAKYGNMAESKNQEIRDLERALINQIHRLTEGITIKAPDLAMNTILGTNEEVRQILFRAVNSYADERGLTDKKAAEERRRYFLERLRNPSDHWADIFETLIGHYYHSIRMASYPDLTTYPRGRELFWSEVQKDTFGGLIKNQFETGWAYRKLASNLGRPSETRGSLNIKLSIDSIHALDRLLIDGVFIGEYKFPDPDTPNEQRHDSITIYFDSPPSVEAIEKIAAIATKFNRGDNLVGKKIVSGFYMSEIETIKDDHVKELAKLFVLLDKELGIKLLSMFYRNIDKRFGMSEGQFYAFKKGLSIFNLDLEYDRTRGFVLYKNGTEINSSILGPALLDKNKKYDLGAPTALPSGKDATIPLKPGQQKIVQIQDWQNSGLTLQLSMDNYGFVEVRIYEKEKYKGEMLVFNGRTQDVNTSSWTVDLRIEKTTDGVRIKNESKRDFKFSSSVLLSLLEGQSRRVVFQSGLTMQFSKRNGALEFQRQGGSMNRLGGIN